GPDGRRRGGGDAGAGRRVRRRFRRAIPSGALTPALGDALTADVHFVQPLEACRRQVAPLHRTPMSDPTGQAAIDSVLKEHRVFPPPEHFSRRANVPSRARYDELYRRSVEDPEAFWGEMAGRLRWTTRWERVLDWQPPFAKWFVGGRLNIADNCLDRHLAGPRRLPAGRRRAAQGERRRGDRGRADHPERRGRAADGRGRADGGRPRSLVARARRERLAGVPRRAARQRASALRPLHERHHGP